MQGFNKILAACFLTALILVQISCDLINTTDVKPVNELSENQAITNISGAQNILYGTYGIIKGPDFYAYFPGSASLMGLTMEPGTFAGSSENQFYINDVSPNNYYVDGMYTNSYKVINNTNHIISKTRELNTDDPRKDEIIAEARFLRALANFKLLRRFGQFYDTSSKYGIVLRKTPVENAKPIPRSSVKDVYDLILKDLDFAVKNGPDFDNPFYASKLAAKALEAKVLLYKKEYGKSATLAKEVMGSPSVELEKTYADIFEKKITNTKEVILQTPFDEKNDRNNKAFMFRAYFQPSEYYINFMEGDPRESVAVTSEGRNNKFNGSTFNGQSLTADTQYFLRLDEIYLIYAEAAVRSNRSLSDARKAINKIRSRASASLVTSDTKGELLEDIRKEKILELGAENGEEWFDLIRYSVEGNLDIANFKSEVTSANQYVLPLPLKTVQLSNDIVEQNPGY